MFDLRFGGCAIRKHFEFVELVYTQNSAGVFAIRTGFTAITGGPTGLTFGSGRKVDDLVRVKSRQRNFTGSRQIQIIRG